MTLSADKFEKDGSYMFHPSKLQNRIIIITTNHFSNFWLREIYALDEHKLIKIVSVSLEPIFLSMKEEE